MLDISCSIVKNEDMTVKRLLKALILLLLIFNYLSKVEAQDTFGPICDDITVTCVPTETPTVTPTLAPGAPSSTPAATVTTIPGTTLTIAPSLTPVGQGGVESPPEELLRAGISDYQNFFILLAALLVSVGLFGKLLPWAFRK